ncbi:hypothetical protein J3459_012468 [Metarhizium acridum]|uniref:uncharacterized protein n=1 Tax=Metarhizium acridum TaxID=92637 RepID=UPI001C6A9498|nr:hypothetical protein J3458_012301 [Metarhizium acridum]KAG8417263.1 hypothetical protein J3459_012468 [Metarhizium acridum]
MMDLHCYDETTHALALRRLGIYLRRAMDAYYWFRSEQTAPGEVVSSKGVARPIFLVSTADDDAAAFLETDKNSRKIFIEFPSSRPSYRLHSVRVPETYWNAHGAVLLDSRTLQLHVLCTLLHHVDCLAAVWNNHRGDHGIYPCLCFDHRAGLPYQPLRADWPSE